MFYLAGRRIVSYFFFLQAANASYNQIVAPSISALFCLNIINSDKIAVMNHMLFITWSGQEWWLVIDTQGYLTTSANLIPNCWSGGKKVGVVETD